jgi:hypothetical protein
MTCALQKISSQFLAGPLLGCLMKRDEMAGYVAGMG